MILQTTTVAGLVLAMPILFSTVIGAGTKTSPAPALQQTPSQQTATAAEHGNFRDSLRFKLKMANEAVRYGGSSLAPFTFSSTEAPGAGGDHLEEALVISSAEAGLGVSQEVGVNEEAMRRLLAAPPIGPGHRRLTPAGGTKHAAEQDRRRFKAAIRTHHTYEFRPVHIEQLQAPPEPRIIEVDAHPLPLEIHFKSASSRIKMVQSHQAAEIRDEERTQTEEEPQRMVHLVRKPIIQEVREIISPYRRIVQEIQPVVEEVHTVISHNAGHPDEQRHISPTEVEEEGAAAAPDQFQRLRNIENFVRATSRSSPSSSSSPAPPAPSPPPPPAQRQLARPATTGYEQQEAITPARLVQQRFTVSTGTPFAGQTATRRMLMDSQQFPVQQRHQSFRDLRGASSNHHGYYWMNQNGGGRFLHH